MTTISSVKALITSRLASGATGGITAEKLRDSLEQLCDAIISDRIAANVDYSSPVSPLTATDVEAALDEIADVLNLKAALASPALTGTPTAPTASSAVSSTQLATTAFVHAVVSDLVDSAPGALDTLNELAAALGDDANFSATMTTALAGKLALAGGTMTGDLTLSGAPDADLKAATKKYVDDADALITAGEYKKNYIVNPGMRISQENGTSSGTSNGYYMADQWRSSHSQDGTLTYAQVASATPGGSTHRVRMTVTSADASIGASQRAMCAVTELEGQMTSDLQWGTSDAVDVVLRFGFKGPAGTYAVAIVNQDSDRSYVREFTISGGEADTDTLQTLTFPGDTSGTWDKNHTLSHSIYWTVAIGSTLQTTADAWQAGEYYGTSSTSNGIGTVSEVFEVFDAGLYADPDSLGVAPRFKLLSYEEDLAKCERYFWKSDGSSAYFAWVYSSSRFVGVWFPTTMRDTPSVSATGSSFTIDTTYPRTNCVYFLDSSSSGSGTVNTIEADARL